MQELVFTVDVNDADECLKVAKAIVDEKLSVKDMLAKYADKDFNTSAANEKEFLLKQVVKFLKILLEYTLKKELVEKPQEDKKPLEVLEKPQENLEELLKKAHVQLEILQNTCKELEGKCQGLEQENVDLRGLLKQHKYYAENYNEKIAEVAELQKKVKELTSKLVDLEPQYMMKVYQRHKAIDEEVKSSMLQEIPKWQKAATRIQALWKGKKARQNYLKLIKVHAESLFKSKQTPEHQLLKHLLQVLKKSKLTLEECYRAADFDSDGTVSCEEFSRFISKLKLNISTYELTRLIAILDDDMSGRLESQEFYETLAAYHVITDTSKVKGYNGQVVNRFVDCVKSRNLDVDAVFNSCDINGDGEISMEELANLLKSLGLKKREIIVLEEVLDSDRSGVVSWDEFLRHLDVEVPFFQIEAVAGTHSMKMSKSVNAIIKLIEDSGVTISSAFDLIHFPSSGKVQISYIASAFAKLFPTVNAEDIRTLLSSIDSSKTGTIQYKDLIIFLHSYCEPSTLSLSQAYSYISSTLQSQNLSFRDLLTQKNFLSTLDISSFIKLLTSHFNLSQSQTIEIFNELSHHSGQVTLKDLENKFEKQLEYHDNTSPRTKAEDIIKKVLGILGKSRLKILNVFRCADKENSGKVTAPQFAEALEKLVPSLDSATLKEFCSLLPSVLTVRDLEVLVPEKKAADIDQFGLKEEDVYWILLLRVSIEKLGTSYQVIYRDADKDGNGKISLEEFKGAVKRCIPGSLLTYTDICMVFKAFDTDASGFIEENEFKKRLDQCLASIFYEKLKDRVVEERGNYDMYKTPIKQLAKPQEFPIPPLPLSHISKKPQLDSIFAALVNCIPKEIPTHEYLSQYKLRLTSIISSKHISYIFHLSQYEASEVFSALDLHSRGIIYCFMLCTVLDSYRTSMQMFPVQKNQFSDEHLWGVINRVLINVQEVPVFSILPNLNFEVVWEKITCLPLETQDLALLRQNLPRNCYFYHIAAMLLNHSIGMVICPAEVLHNVISNSRIRVQAADYFGNYSLHPSDIFERGEFIDKFSRILEVSTVETDTLATVAYQNQTQCPLFSFFTFFDMVLSTYTDSSVLLNMPKLPFSTEKNINLTAKLFFKKLAGTFIFSPARYGLNVSNNYTEVELAQAFEKVDSGKQEILTYLSLLKMNKAGKIRLYHLLAVLYSYSEASLNLNSDIDLSVFPAQFEKKVSGLVFLKLKSLTLDSTLIENELIQLFPTIPKQSVQAIFGFVDSFNRGYIFGHQLATLIDLSYKSKDIQGVPFSSNTKIDPKISSLFSSNSVHLDTYHKTALSFYLANRIQPEESIDFLKFAYKFASELTEKEAKMVFDSIDLGHDGFIKAFYYIACMESYCRNTSSVSSIITASPLKTLFTIALQIPLNKSTISFFIDLPWNNLIDRDFFYRFLENKFSINIEAARGIYQEIDKYEKKQIFVYQFFSIIDMYRYCIENDQISKEPGSLPYRWLDKDLQADMNFKAFGSRLDQTNRGSCDYFWGMGIDPTETVSLQEFLVTMVDFNSQQAGQMFAALDFAHEGRVVMYHLLAVLESYREKVLENRCRPVISKKVQIVEKKTVVSSLSPLQEALNKLGRYIAGDNPKKKTLTSQEIFGMMDVNRDGVVSMNEFLDCMNLLPLNFSQNQIYLLLKEADLDGNGIIDYQEFTNFLLDFVKKPLLKDMVNVVLPKPVKKEIAGLSMISSIKNNPVHDLIAKLKLYIQSNSNSAFAIELVFSKIDYKNSFSMSPQEFSLALDRLNLGLSQSQKLTLQSLADKNRNSIIPYKDFINFIYDYNFEEIQIESQELIDDIMDYIIEAKDFFVLSKATTTILNSEKAALKRCYELLRGVDKFVDKEFGPELQKNGAFCLYYKGKPPTVSYPKPNELIWKRPNEWLSSPSFFKESISSNDVIQGSLENCWFIGALSVLATRDELIRGSIQSLNMSQQIDISTVTGLFKGVYPPMFHSFAKKGLFVLRFFKEFAWRYVIIDSRLPVFSDSNGNFSYVFAHCADPEELWVPLIEKAYAKLHGCYEALNRGLIDDGLVDLTGLVAEKTSLSNIQSELLWEKLVQYKETQSLLGCSIEGQNGEVEIVKDSEATGLLARHAYAIVDILLVPNPDTPKKRHRLLRIRNPWGQREWTGKWSSKDLKLKNNLKILNVEIEKLGNDEKFDPSNPNDGCFLMSFKDWRNLFSNLYSCVDFPDRWSGVRFKGEWTQSTAGGVPKSVNIKDAKDWAANPQYLIEAKANCEVFISLAQCDGRFKGGVFPYQKSINYICFAVMKLLGTENCLKQFDETNIFKLSKLKLHREVNIRTVLPAGRYVIVPATKAAGKTGPFWLSIYFSCEKSEISCSLQTKQGEFIVEEEEVAAVSHSLIKSQRDLFEKISEF